MGGGRDVQPLDEHAAAALPGEELAANWIVARCGVLKLAVAVAGSENHLWHLMKRGYP